MLVLPVTLAALLLVCIARFGRAGFVRLATLRLRGGALALGAGSLQVVSALTHQHRLELLLVSAVLLAGFCWLNRRERGLILITVGIALNMAVMTANGGAMPISPAILAQQTGLHIAPGTALPSTKDVVLADDTAKLAPLSDRLLLPAPLTPIAAWSIGDVFLLSGVARLLWRTMKGTDYAGRSLWNSTASP
jgi:hypothetical protein